MNTSGKQLFSLLVLAMATTAFAAEEQRSVEAKSDGVVTVTNVSGSIDISGWSRDQVEVTANLGSQVEEFIVERDGDNVVIEVKTPRSSTRNADADLVIRVPENSSLDVGAVSADIEVSGVFGEQRLRAVSGDIASAVFESDIQAEVVSGDIDITGQGKSVLGELNSVSGTIEVTGLAGDIDISSVSGDLIVAGGVFSRAQVNTVNGDIDFRTEIAENSRLDMETINGSIDLHFAGEISARFDVETFNGSIRNCFGPTPERTSRYMQGQGLKFTAGSGSARVTLRTLNGRIDICRD